MLTAFGQKREIEEGYKVKADDYIVKPFEPLKLRQRVKKFLSR
jgi:DNA-binding response OmpR family regulator